MGEKLLGQIGQKIRAARKTQGLTQESLAEKAGISYKYLGEVERGRINPGIVSYDRISSALGIPLKYIVDVGVEEADAAEKNHLLEEILVLIAAKQPRDLEKALRILRTVFS